VETRVTMRCLGSPPGECSGAISARSRTGREQGLILFDLGRRGAVLASGVRVTHAARSETPPALSRLRCQLAGSRSSRWRAATSPGGWLAPTRITGQVRSGIPDARAAGEARAGRYSCELSGDETDRLAEEPEPRVRELGLELARQWLDNHWERCGAEVPPSACRYMQAVSPKGFGLYVFQ
jgi:hypothetical protein